MQRKCVSIGLILYFNLMKNYYICKICKKKESIPQEMIDDWCLKEDIESDFEGRIIERITHYGKIFDEKSSYGEIITMVIKIIKEA